MKGRNTRVLSVRIPEELYEKVQNRAALRQKTLNDWLLWAVNDGLRSRHKRNDHDVNKLDRSEE